MDHLLAHHFRQPYYRFTDEWFSWVVVQWVGVDCFGMRDAIRLHVQVLVLRRLMKELVEDFTRISYFNTWGKSRLVALVSDGRFDYRRMV